MALSADEQALLDELTRKASEPDADGDYEIEIFSGDKGARIPFSKGQKWLLDNFGIGEPPAAAAAAGDAGGQGDGAGRAQGGKGKPGRQGAAEPTQLGSYFGKRAAGK
jgi:hypothetical protein